MFRSIGDVLQGILVELFEVVLQLVVEVAQTVELGEHHTVQVLNGLALGLAFGEYVLAGELSGLGRVQF